VQVHRRWLYKSSGDAGFTPKKRGRACHRKRALFPSKLPLKYQT
jgi:hypothetical protein